MKKIKKYILIGVVLFLSISNITAQSNKFNQKDQKIIKKAVNKIVGTYDNKAQSDTTQNPLLRHSEIRVFRIWNHKENDYWLSIGWYTPGHLDLPLGEKIFHIRSVSKDTFWLDCYSWKKSEDKGKLRAWRAKNPYKNYKIEDLKNDGCGNYLLVGKKKIELKTITNQICEFYNPLAPFDGLFFHFIFDKKGSKMDIYDINYKSGMVLFHYLETPMLMRKI